jgi:hypothetical protein
LPPREDAAHGTETAQKYANVLVLFDGFWGLLPRFFRDLAVADIVVRDVAALVQPDEALGVNLLGMSFLSRVRWTHERGKLILEQ